MKKRSIWILVGSIIVIVAIVVVSGMVYAAHYANTVAQSQTHKASGPIAVTPTPVASSTTSNLQTFQIVSDQTTASYGVYENLIIENNPHKQAVGTTHSVTGSFQTQTGSSPLITGMNIKVDLRTLQSDSERRDNYIQQNTLETSTYPYTTFVSVKTEDLPASYTDGQTVQFKLIGNMTIHGKTNAETFTVEGKVSGDSITGKATTTIFMTDYDMQPPNLANIAIAQNQVDITLDFTAKKG